MLNALFLYYFSDAAHFINGDTMIYYLNMFLVGSFLGFLFENFLKLFVTDLNSGLLHGPWVPVYGFGICIIIFIERVIFNRTRIKRIYKVILMLLLVMVVVTLLEWLGGVFIEKIFDKTLWDYTDLKFNVGKYISLEITLIWGVLTLIFVYVIKPWLEKVIKKIPKYLTILIFMCVLVDFIVTCLEA